MALAAGTKLGSYRVVAQIGAGGMGEVYRAMTRSSRATWPSKFFLEAWAQDGERLARFEREARMLAALNHREHCHHLWPGAVRRRDQSRDGTGSRRDAGRAREAGRSSSNRGSSYDC